VRQISAAGTCGRCGRKLGLRERVLGRALCQQCATEEGDALKKRRRLYMGAITALDLQSDLGPKESGVMSGMTPDLLGADWHHAIATGALIFLYEQAVERGALTLAEDQRISAAARVLRIDGEATRRTAPHLDAQVRVVRANGGILPTLARAPVRLRPGEICHCEVDAVLLADGPAPGVGEPTEAGRWFARGTPIPPSVVAERLAAMNSDGAAGESGRLLVTSQRIVFRSRRRSVHLLYGRLIGFTIYADGLRFRLSGRKRARAFRVKDPAVVAATVNAASMAGSVVSAEAVPAPATLSVIRGS